MILGISSYTFGWALGIPGHAPASPMDEQSLLAQADALGVKLLQIGDNIPLDTFDKSRLKSLGQRAADLGIQLEIGARKLALRTLDRYTKIARLLGALEGTARFSGGRAPQPRRHLLLKAAPG